MNASRIFTSLITLLIVSTVGYSQLNGNYTIGGSSPDYTDFNAAVNDLITNGVSGDVVFDVRSGTYTQRVEIPHITGSALNQSITFRSESGDSTDVVLEYDASSPTSNSVLYLNGGDFLRFEAITIEALDANFGTAVEFDNLATQNVFERCVFKSNSTTSWLVTLQGANHDFNSFFSNRFVGSKGLLVDGLVGQHIDHLRIERNIFFFNVLEAMSISRAENPQIIGNEIVSISVNNNYIGLKMVNVFNGYKVMQNRFSILTGKAVSIVYSTFGWLANNMIQMNGMSANSNNTCIHLGNGTRNYVVNNSCYIDTSGGSDSRCVFVEDIAGSGSNLQLINNNLYNGGLGYAIYVSDTVVLDTCDYNNLFTNGPYVGYWGQNKESGLADWQNASGKDMNSLYTDPMYHSVFDLHACAMALNGAGLPLDSIMTDYDGDVRSVTMPDIGADEFFPIGSIQLPEDSTICMGDSIQLSAGSFVQADYLWSTGDSSEAIAISTAGTYTLTVSNNCESFSDTVEISLMNCGTGLGSLSESALSVYPNPISRYQNAVIELVAGIEVLEIRDATGKVIREIPCADEQRMVIDVSKLGSGIYFILAQGELQYWGRLVVQ